MADDNKSELGLLLKIVQAIQALPLQLGVAGVAAGGVLGVGGKDEPVPGTPSIAPDSAPKPVEVPGSLLDAFEASAVGVMEGITESITRLTEAALGQITGSAPLGAGAAAFDPEEEAEATGTSPVIESVISEQETADEFADLLDDDEIPPASQYQSMTIEEEAALLESFGLREEEKEETDETNYYDDVAEAQYGIAPEPAEEPAVAEQDQALLPEEWQPTEEPPVAPEETEEPPETENKLPPSLITRFDTLADEAREEDKVDTAAAAEQEAYEQEHPTQAFMVQRVLGIGNPDPVAGTPDEWKVKFGMEDDPDKPMDLAETIDDQQFRTSSTPLQDAKDIMKEKEAADENFGGSGQGGGEGADDLIKSIAEADDDTPDIASAMDEAEDGLGEGEDEVPGLLRDILEAIRNGGDGEDGPPGGGGGGDDSGDDSGAGSSGGDKEGGGNMIMQSIKKAGPLKTAGVIAAAAFYNPLYDDRQRGGGIRSLDAVKAEAQEAANASRGKDQVIGSSLMGRNGFYGYGALGVGWSAIQRIDTGPLVNALNRVI